MSPSFVSTSNTITTALTGAFGASENYDVCRSTRTSLAEDIAYSVLDSCALVLSNVPADNPVPFVATTNEAIL